MTIATLLSGGEGVGVGAEAAGLSHLWGIEINDDIAGVARENGFNVITGDILETDAHTLEAPDVLHASPECQNASNAKHNPDADTLEEKETGGDVEIAGAIVRYLEVLRPRIFTLENVYGYRRFQSFRLIMVALANLDYFSDVQHLNAADFGVPQSRKRLILRAVRGGLVPPLPAPEPWRGWYEAIEDLIPTLPASEFAPWQKARLGELQPDGTFLQMSGATSSNPVTRGTGVLEIMEPANTVALNSGHARAFILAQGGYDGNVVRAEANSPIFAITANSNQGGLRAFVIGGQFGKPDDGSGEPRIPQIRYEDEPIFTVTAINKGDWRAQLISGGQGDYRNGQQHVTVREKDVPAFTVTASEVRRPSRAWLLRGRVVKMTPCCLARFQSFPDSYELPDANGLACRVIGNAVPPLMYEKLAGDLV